MDLLTAYKGSKHLTSKKFRSIVESIIGSGSYIANLEEFLEPELAANNKLKIRSGILIHHGGVMYIERGTYDEVTYQNGNQAMKRIDLVVARYIKEENTGIESSEWVVIQGTPDESSPVAPAYTEGNMQNGDLVDDCPVFELHFDGINVTEVKQLLPVIPNIPELNRKLDSKFVIKTTTLSDMAVNGGTTASKTVSVALDGYKPLFIGYPNWVGPNSGYTLLYGCHLEDNDNLVFNMRNMGTNAASITASFPIWYIAI